MTQLTMSPHPSQGLRLSGRLAEGMLGASAKSQTSDPLLGQLLDGRYTLERLIGEGETGRVYRARQEATGREVAVKVLRESLIHDQASVRRFQREARAACRINHPNAITVHDFGTTSGGHCYLVTELIEGETLRAMLDREGLLPPPRALWLFREILQGVAAAHERGVVHRDLHPGNILLSRGENGEVRVKVFDFGGARLLDSSQDTDVTGANQLDLKQLLGSIRYLSPERLTRHCQPDPRADVYSLGLILFELCTGRYPFPSDDPLQIMAMHLREPPPLLTALAPDRTFSPALQGLLSAMLAKDPALRPQSAGAVAERMQIAEERQALITMSAVVPEPEVEMEMVALPADEEEDLGLRDIPRTPTGSPLAFTLEAPPEWRQAVTGTSSARAEAALLPTLPASGDVLSDTVPDRGPPAQAAVPQRPSVALGRRPPPRALRVLFAVLWLFAGAAITFASGMTAFRYHQKVVRERAAKAANVNPAVPAEPAPAPLTP